LVMVEGVGYRAGPHEHDLRDSPGSGRVYRKGSPVRDRRWRAGDRRTRLEKVRGEVSLVGGRGTVRAMTASRRLQLAAEGSGTIGLAIRRWQRLPEAAEFGLPTAATTRWRITALPSTPLPVPGVGRARWRLELVRCRRGESAEFEVEACDAQGRLALPPNLGHGRLPHVVFFDQPVGRKNRH
jgi:hypothetical protein